MLHSIISLMLALIIALSSNSFYPSYSQSNDDLTLNNKSSVETVSLSNELFSSYIHYSEIIGTQTRSVSESVYSEYLEGYVFTPNGTDVALTFDDYILDLSLYPNKNVVRSEDVFTDDDKASMINYVANMGFVGIELIGEANSAYNCHSYAWYSQDIDNNNIWIKFPYDYYSTEDGSYMEVTTPRVGDIIVYFDTDELIVRKEAIHSGIVVGFSGEAVNNNCEDANTVIVESKWGSFPLYRHKGDECPYTSNYGGTADEVRYYRPRTSDSCDLSSTSLDVLISESISSDQDITDTYVMYELNVTESGYYDIIVSSDYAANVELFDSHMHEISIHTYDSSDYMYFYILHLPIGRYYLRSEYTESNDGQIVTSIENHDEHDFHYKMVNSGYHILKCRCGLTSGTNQAHSFKSGGTDGLGNSYYECISCGYRKNSSSTDPFFPIIKDNISDEVTNINI